jgi:hypothetical protein
MEQAAATSNASTTGATVATNDGEATNGGATNGTATRIITVATRDEHGARGLPNVLADGPTTTRKEQGADAEYTTVTTTAAKLAKGEAAVAIVTNMRAEFTCSTCYEYVPVVGYGRECIAGHVLCKVCAAREVATTTTIDNDGDVEEILPQGVTTMGRLRKCPECREDLYDPIQHNLYTRLGDKMTFDCQVDLGGCG